MVVSAWYQANVRFQAWLVKIKTMAATGDNFFKRIWSVASFMTFFSRKSLKVFAGPFAKLQYPTVTYDGFVNETKPRRDHRVLEDAAQAAAKEIGVSTNDLKDARKNGKSIAQVAQDHGKSVDDVVNAVVKAATADVDQAVKDGKLDSQRADQIKMNLPDRAKTLVERQPRQGSASTPGTQ